jgi:hypothetical protein
MGRRAYDKQDFFGALAERISGVPSDKQKKFNHYKYNPADFISEQLYTVSDIDPPNGKFRSVKLVVFPAQRDLINKIVIFDDETGEFYIDDTHLEKSRQMGMSWILTGIGLWAIQFWPNVNGLYISRKEDEVDDGGNRSTIKSLFGKVRYQYEHQEQWLQDMAKLDFKFLHIINEGNNSWIMGESANPNAGRGGTFKFVVCDEWAFVPNSEAVYSAVSRACPRGKILNSTPFGIGNNYARLKRMHQKGQETGFKYIRLHWSQNPMYSRGMEIDSESGRMTSPWYKKTIQTMTVEQIARELEISYSNSMSGLVYPEFNIDIDVLSETDAWKADFDARKGPVYVGWDFGLNDPTALLLIQKNELGGYDVFNELQAEGQPIENFVPYVQSWQNDTYKGVDFLHWGDIAGTQREQVTGSSVIETLAYLGVYVQSKKQGVQDGIRKIRLMHQQRQIRVHPRCITYIECKTNHHYPLDPTGKPREGIEVPYHDWSSHICAAERYVVMGVFEEGEITADSVMTGGSHDGEGDWTADASMDAEIFGVVI